MYLKPQYATLGSEASGSRRLKITPLHQTTAKLNVSRWEITINKPSWGNPDDITMTSLGLFSHSSQSTLCDFFPSSWVSHPHDLNIFRKSTELWKLQILLVGVLFVIYREKLCDWQAVQTWWRWSYLNGSCVWCQTLRVWRMTIHTFSFL